MRHRQRGSALIIAVIVVLIIAVIGVGMVRFTQRQVAGALAGTRGDAVSACAEAARKLLESRFHALAVKQPLEIDALNVRLDGPEGRMAAVGGHIDADPAQLLVTVKQVEAMGSSSVKTTMEAGDLTNTIGWRGKGTGTPLRVTVHCQEGDLSTPTSGRQVEIEYGVKFGL